MSMIGNYLRVPLTQLAQLRAQSERILEFLYPNDLSRRPNHLDIDKSWHAVHFLLNGDTWEGKPPLVNAVLGGEIVGDIDVGYGPARFLLPDEVRDLAEALSSISPEDLLERFDAQAVNDADIYPHGWRDEQHERDYVADNYRKLVEFFLAAAKAGDAVIMYLN